MLALIMSGLISMPALFAATYYVSPTGSDGSGSGSSSNPWATLNKGFSSMSANDTLVMMNGMYTGASNMFNSSVAGQYPPGGTGGNYTTIKAETPGGVIIDGEMTRMPFSGGSSSYIAIDGIIFRNSSEDVFRLIGASGSKCTYWKITRCGFSEANSTFVNPRFNNFLVRWGDYILIEDCYTWGNGKYRFYILDSEHVILRRCVDRFDRGYGDGSLMASFRLYGANYCILQNCISVDCDQKEYILDADSPKSYAQPKLIWFGSNFFSTGNNCDNNIVDGCIVLNCTANSFAGFIGSDSHVSSNTISNSVFWKTAKSFWTRVPSTSGLIKFSKCVFGGTSSDSHDYGIEADIANCAEAKNSILYSLEYYALKYVDSDYNCLYANNTGNYTGGSAGANDYCSQNANAFDPLYFSTNTSGGLKYLVRVESGSNLSGKASDGGAIGATIVKKIGVSGSLYGEAGYNDVTADDLWPFPYESTIRRHMREYSYDSGNLTGKRGFCADGTTLTKYIWEYLGNAMPAGMYSLVAPSGLAASAASATAATLTWTDSSVIETGYKVERKTGADGTYAEIGQTGAFDETGTYTDSGLTASATYWYRVRAFDDSSNSAYSNEASFSLSNLAPSGLTAAAASASSVNLAWTDNSAVETGYKIERKTGSGGTYAEVAQTTAFTGRGSYSDTGLTQATTYWYRVRAYDASGDSAYSNEISVFTSFSLSDVPALLAAGELKIVGSAEGRGTVNPDKGDTAKIFFKGSGTGLYECRVFAVSGEMVWSDSKDGISEGYFEWLPRNMASGVYVAYVKGPGISAKKKIVVIR